MMKVSCRISLIDDNEHCSQSFFPTNTSTFVMIVYNFNGLEAIYTPVLISFDLSPPAPAPTLALQPQAASLKPRYNRILLSTTLHLEPLPHPPI